nr:uncharacterized protein LOC117702370 [Arvicanthis niloticus]
MIAEAENERPWPTPGLQKPTSRNSPRCRASPQQTRFRNRNRKQNLKGRPLTAAKIRAVPPSRGIETHLRCGNSGEKPKQFFHYKIWQEHTKSRAKPEDFTYKEIHMKTTGFREHACYLSGCGLTRNQQDRSVVCIANPKAQISAWDIHEDREDGEPQPKQLREEEEEHRELRLQNYVPEDEDMKRCRVPQAKPVAVEEKVKEQLEAAKPEPVIEEVDLANLAPRKPDWDLKRDVAKKLEKLEKQTQSAIAELIRERLKDQKDSLASAVAANIEPEACDSD